VVTATRVRILTTTEKAIEVEGVLDTGSRWTWVSKRLSRELGIELSGVKRSVRTADNRLVEGVLADEPVDLELIDYKVHLWITPCVAEWLARDTIIGNDFMDKAGIRLVKEGLELYDPVGELYWSWSVRAAALRLKGIRWEPSQVSPLLKPGRPSRQTA